MASILLLVGFFPVGWPFEIPGAVAGRLWLSNVYEPVLRALTSPGTTFFRATRSHITWWPFAMGIALLVPVLGMICRSDCRQRKIISLIALSACLGGVGATNALYASNTSTAFLVLGIGLGLGVGFALAHIGRGVVEDGPIALSRRLARTISILLILAGIGIGSFVLLPVGSLALALALATIAFAYGRAAMALRKTGRPAEAGQPDRAG